MESTVSDLSSVAESASEAAGRGAHPVFWIIVALAAVGLVVMVIQNFFIKKEEYYK